MKRSGVIGPVLLIAQFAVAGGEKPGNGSGEAPYVTLYEEGFYDEAIGFIDSLLAGGAGDRNARYYRAACFIARGDRDSGAAEFERMLVSDTGFQLDTLFTPPKILEVFLSVRARTGQITALTDDTTSRDTSSVTAEIRPLPENPVSASPSLSAPSVPGAAPPGIHPAVRASLGLLPGGVGQFSQHKPLRGVFICAVEFAAVTGTVWAYRMRQSRYDDRYGWYEGNRSSHLRYTGYCRWGFALFLGTYAFGVIDYFSTVRRESGRRTGERDSPGD